MVDPTPPASPPPANPPSGNGFESAGAVPSASRRPATVRSGHGTSWWSEGWRLFKAEPGIWIAITVVFIVILAMISMIPILGSVATSLIAPVLAGGVLVGCRTIDRGGQLTIGTLFASFSDRLVPLIVVGVLYIVGELLIVALIAASLIATIGFGGLSALFTGDPLEGGYAVLASLGMGAVLTLLIGLLLGIPLMMAYWFAPALVVFRNDEPLAAMKASFDACLANMMPMLVYSLVGIALAFVASIPLLLGWLVLAPVFAGSVYASYKDIFGDAG
jgi:uncharacterized membrane protein